MTAALEQGKRAVAIYPGNILQLNNVGLFAMYSGDFDTAISDSNKLLQKNQTFVKAYDCLAMSQLGLGRTAYARPSYEKLSGFGQSGASAGAVVLAVLSKL